MTTTPGALTPLLEALRLSMERFDVLRNPCSVCDDNGEDAECPFAEQHLTADEGLKDARAALDAFARRPRLRDEPARVGYLAGQVFEAIATRRPGSTTENLEATLAILDAFDAWLGPREAGPAKAPETRAEVIQRHKRELAIYCSANGCFRFKGDGKPLCGATCFARGAAGPAKEGSK